MDYRITLVAKSDETAVNEFIRDHFYTSEPLNIAMRAKFDASHPDGSPHAVHATLKNIANGLSLKAEDRDGNIVGVVINSAPVDGLETTIDQIIGDRPLVEEIINFVKLMHEQVSYQQNVPVMAIKRLTVSTAHRKQGIGARLIRESLSIADSKNLALSVGCSSAYTSQIVEKFPQFRRVLSFPYTQYTDSQGEVVFRLPAPHKTFDVYLSEK